MDTENYLNWSVGASRTVQILSESLTQDDFWFINFRFAGKQDSQFWAVMNRRTSNEAAKYTPTGPRSSALSFDNPRYVREAKFPAAPTTATVSTIPFSLEPGQFRMFEVSGSALPKTRNAASFRLYGSPARVPDFLFSGKENSLEIDFDPGDIASPYSIRVYLEHGTERRLLYESPSPFATAGNQSILFKALVDPLWPLVNNRIVVAVEAPGVLHQELSRRDVSVSPANADTDGDGLTDYDERYIYLTKPDTEYSDEDSFTDAEEIALGTDPNKRDTDGDLVDDDKDVFPLHPLRSTHDIAAALDLLLLSPTTDLTAIGPDKVDFSRTKIYPTSSDKTGCVPETSFVGRLGFDALLTSKSGTLPFSGLMIEISELANAGTGKQENKLIAPDGRMAGVGDRFAVPQIGNYSDGILSPGESLGLHFDVCLGSTDRFTLLVNLLGTIE
jgi:hypothetical protein